MMTKRTRIGIALAGWLWRWMGSSCLRDLLEKFGQTNHFPCNHIVLCYLLLICTIIATTITNNLKCIQYFIVEGGGGGRTDADLLSRLLPTEWQEWTVRDEREHQRRQVIPPRKRTTWCGRSVGSSISCNYPVNQPVKCIDPEGDWRWYVTDGVRSWRGSKEISFINFCANF